MRKHKFLAVLLAFVMTLTLLPTAALAEEDAPTLLSGETSTWDGTSVDTEWYTGDSPYTISTAAGLAGLAKLVNEGNNFSGKTITLGDDIDLDNKEWTPIGNGSKSFNGTFDGQNHTISNLQITKRYSGYGNGFFRQMNGTVKNVTFDGANVSNSSTNITGVVAGYTAYYSMNTVYENVTVKNSTVEGYGKVGAIAGMTEMRGQSHIVLKNCSVQDTTVKGTYDMGGVIGLVQGTIDLSGTTTKNVTFVTSGTHVRDKVKVTCVDGPETCPGKDTIVEGDFWVYYGCYWGGYADFYVKYGDSSHDCTLEGTSYQLANSELPYSAAVTIKSVDNVVKYASQDDARAANPDFDTAYAAKNGTNYYSNADDAIADAASGDTIYLKQPTSKEKVLSDGEYLTIVSETEGAVWTGAVAGEGVRVKSETTDNTTTYSTEVDSEKAAAKVGDTYYATLDAAVNETTTGTIEVLKNVDLGSSYITIGADKDITLELNGYTVESTADYVFSLSSTGKLTVQDSSTGKTGTIQGNTKYGIRTSSTSVIVNVKSGNIVGKTTGLYGYYGGTITIDGGKITGGQRGLDMYDAGTCTLNGGTIEGGENSVYVRNSTANVNISGGMYSGAVYKTSGTVTISGGYFTNDPTAYLATGKALVTSDKADYIYKVGDSAKIEVGDGETPVKVEVHPAPDTSPKADTANMTTSTENAEEAAAQKAAVKTAIESATSNGLNAEAAAVAEDSNKVTKTHVANGLEEVKKPTEQGGLGLADTTTASDIKLVVQPYLDIEAKSYTATATEKTLNVEISPKYNLLATTSGTDVTALNTTGEGGSKNAVIVESNKDLPTDENTQVTINFQLPSGFITDAQMDKVFVVHTKQDRSTETYKATVTKSGGIYTATFTTNGFSPFVFTVDTRSAQVQFKDKDGNSIGSAVTYLPTNVGDALPTTAAPDGQIFGGWQFADINGTYTTLTDALLTALDTKTDPITATPYFYTPSYGGSGSSTTTYPVSASSNVKNGTVTVSPKNAAKGATVTITVKPDKGYELDSLTVTDKNGDQVKLTDKGNGKYTFTMPASKVDVKTSFVEAKTSGTNPFVDVSESAYYYDAVLWAVENGITGGTTDTTFSPNASCTRAQAVTFLWRAAGSPAPKSSAMPFGDVAADAYYHDAVLWAMEQGITQGTTATAFSPNAVCTRGQIVTFLWRAEASEAAGTVSAFTDVASNAYYAGAVDWAVENGITQGTTATTFSPAMNCTRAQIVTFLYRDYQGK